MGKTSHHIGESMTTPLPYIWFWKSRLLSLNKGVVDDIISAYDDYIKVLSDEIQSSASYLAIHGWKSTRVEAGRLARERVERCKKALVGKEG